LRFSVEVLKYDWILEYVGVIKISPQFQAK
jgi:hypothetical protein